MKRSVLAEVLGSRVQVRCHGRHVEGVSVLKEILSLADALSGLGIFVPFLERGREEPSIVGRKEGGRNRDRNPRGLRFFLANFYHRP